MDNIAIVGMSGRFPGAGSTQAFWQNLRNGVESISFFNAEELAQVGIPASALEQPSFVPAGGVLDDVDLFDALFFGFNARDAEIMDPQQRLFLECAWESLEDAGYNPDEYEGAIGVYAGQSLSTYVFNIYNSPERVGHVDHMQLLLLNDKDHLTTHVSYKLNLNGPSMAIQSACSTSLVAVCVACDALWNRRCDMALAGGVAISIPQRKGYVYQAGGIMSPDGHCRSFDARARGTVGGNGVGIVVLKRLSDALAERDHIYALIRGAALNNDGSFKVGYTAPSVPGQAAVIASAQAMAEVHPDTISYIETHGTATQLGDPIEIAALTEAFRLRTDRKGFCAIGSVKTNVGHLDPAAGVTGLLKTALALYHRELPPSLHFTEPNPQIDFANSPFFVNTTLKEWKANGTPRRAGVSSFGIGGTNAHCVLEEPPAQEASGPSRSHVVVPLSAKTKTALDAQTDRLAVFLRGHPDVNLPDVAYVLQVGRKGFAHRRVLLTGAHDVGQAASLLEARDPERLLSNTGDARERPVAFLFPGQGSQYVGMGHELYATEAVFRGALDRCSEHLRSHIGCDLRHVLYRASSDSEAAAEQLTRTALAQPALFAIEYALSQLWMAWGVTPQAMIGHSIGEYVAACLAGVMSLETALELVALRGRLMDALPRGSMLAVPLSEQEVRGALSGTLALAAINGPSASVVAGTTGEIEALERRLAARGLPARRLATSHAFHSSMMEPAIVPFVAAVRRVALAEPKIPYLSNVTGTWITPEDALDPEYYGRQLRQPVRLADGLNALWAEPDWVFLEVGPGHTLSSMARQQPADGVRRVVVASLGTGREPRGDSSLLLDALGRLWLAGASVAWPSFAAGERRRRLALPTYPFERQRYWVGPPDKPIAAGSSSSTAARRPIGDWFYVPSWSQVDSVTVSRARWTRDEHWLLFADVLGVAEALARTLRSRGQQVTIVGEGDCFLKEREDAYSLRAAVEADYDDLLREMKFDGRMPRHVIHLWLFTADDANGMIEATARFQQTGFRSMMCLAQAFGRHAARDAIDIGVVSNRLQAVVSADRVDPGKALILGPCRVMPEEYPDLTCRSIDLDSHSPAATAADQIIRELVEESAVPIVAYRDGARWLQSFESVRVDPASDAPRVKDGGVYLLTGGLGGIAVSLAQSLARAVKSPHIVLVSRSKLPDRNAWDVWLAEHDNATSRTLRTLREIESTGADVMLATADVADREAMAFVVDEVLRRYGAIDGVVHAAGVAGGGMIQLKAPQVAAAVLRPKVDGTLVLDALLEGRQLDFFAICSSLASVYGGFGQVDYCAANNFIDAYAQAGAAQGRRVISINWDTWREVGMAVKTQVPPELQESRRRSLELGITPSEGGDTFLTILAAGLAQVAVSTTDLQVMLEGGSKTAADTSSPPVDPSAAAVRMAHSRPSLATAYTEPRSETEQTLAGIWQDLLGVAPVGVHDNFFELGGHSLLAIQFISQVRTAFDFELSVQNLFDKPTVAMLAAQIDSAKAELADVDMMASLLDQVERLSEREVEALLDSGGLALAPGVPADHARGHSE